MKAVGRKNLDSLRNFLKENKIDAALFIDSDVNVRYFSNFIGACILTIDQEKRILFTMPIEFERAKEQADVEEVVNIEKFNYNYGEAINKKLKTYKKFGIVKNNFPLKIYEDFKKRMKANFVDIENFLSELRAIKFKKEIELIKKSANIANSGIKVIEEILHEIIKGRKIKEKELANRIEMQLKDKGAEGLAFGTLVASGKRSSYPHPYPYASEQIIKSGLGYVDFGARYHGYCSDITVPFVIGKINEKQKKIIQTVQEAYKLAIDSIEVDLPTWKLDEKVEAFLKSRGFSFVHGLGHGLGLTVHDAPSITKKPTDKIQLKEWREVKFKENMVFTIEPGIYTEGVGCRLENDILLTKKGINVLTNANILEG